MNKTELMINDWVLVKYTKHVGDEHQIFLIKTQVKEIHDVMVYVVIDKVDIKEPVPIDYNIVYPIPLTETILQDSDFIKCHKKGEENIKEKTVWLLDELEIIQIKDDNGNRFYYNNGNVCFKHVHELQHIMKLHNLTQWINVKK